jgi:pentatricopeptide repeat protein
LFNDFLFILVNGYAVNGMAYQALELFHQMPENYRDSWTYVSLLNACSHSGLVGQAYTIFNEIPLKTQQMYTVMVIKIYSFFPTKLSFFFSG